ncbi:hypothetical protein D3C87_153660 [compost metagenome]
MWHTILLKIKNRLFGNYPRLSYSRGGEDILIEEILGFKNKGFYVDVGAFDPVRFSNTYKFYLQGWSGINIDASNHAIKKLNKIRSKDINLHCAVGELNKSVEFFELSDPSMNTTVSSFKETAELEGILTKSITTIQQYRLDTIFAKHLQGKTIDFMSVDVEGADLAVLKSNDWNLYRPKIILVETNSSINDIKDDEIVSFMHKLGYKAQAYTLVGLLAGNIIFMDHQV